MNNVYTTDKTTFVRDTMANPGKTSIPGADKISTSDYVKQSKTACDNLQYCWHRLPCGLCCITNQPCPYGGKVRYEVTC